MLFWFLKISNEMNATNMIHSFVFLQHSYSLWSLQRSSRSTNKSGNNETTLFTRCCSTVCHSLADDVEQKTVFLSYFFCAKKWRAQWFAKVASGYSGCIISLIPESRGVRAEIFRMHRKGGPSTHEEVSYLMHDSDGI